MLSRRSIFLLSLALGAALYATLFYIAPRVIMYANSTIAENIPRRFQILIAKSGEPAPAPKIEEGGSELASRPGTVNDLLEWGETEADPIANAPAAPAEIPGLLDRAMKDDAAREHDLAPDPEALKRIDARIVEIERENMRDGVEVARRLVRPSPDTLVPDGAMPSLRVPLDPGEDTRTRFDSTALSLLSGQPGTGRAQGEGIGGQPAFDLPPADLPPPEKLPAIAKAEERIAAAPLQREQYELKEANPYEFLDDLLDIRLDVYQPPDEKQGYFRLRILPKDKAAIQPLPKQVTFVVDTSNSIPQHKLTLTARGTARALDMLRPGDYFNIVAFRDTPAKFQENLVPATDATKTEARKFLESLQSKGETDVYKALLPETENTPPAGTPSIVFVSSDGRPTAGIKDSRAIINGLTTDNNLRNSIFAFGGGNTVDRYLLDLLAYRNKGQALVVDDIAKIDASLPEFAARLKEPLLVDLDADYGRINGNDVFPSILPDFYRGQPVTIYGRFDPKEDASFVMRLTGQAETKKKEVVFRAALDNAEKGDFAIARDWAFQKAYHLIGEISRQGQTPELAAELQRLTQKYNIRTSYSGG